MTDYYKVVERRCTLATTLAQIQTVIEDVMATFQVPGMVVAFMRNGEAVEHLVYGTDATGYPLSEITLFPVASVTKLATALTILRLADAGALSLDAPIANYVPDAAASQDGVTVQALLTHTGGLPIQYDNKAIPCTEMLTWPIITKICLQTQLSIRPKTQVSYSNVGYMLLGIIVERVTDQPFANALKTIVLDPLSIEGYFGIEPPRRPARIEDVKKNAETPFESYNTLYWRARASPDGGLLTTAAGALQLIRVFLGEPNFLHAETITAATSNQVGNLGGGLIEGLEWPLCPWGLGPELRGAKTPHWTPTAASSNSFGHIGASGCIVWVDPIANVTWAILGTRTTSNLWNQQGFAAIGNAILALTQ